MFALSFHWEGIMESDIQVCTANPIKVRLRKTTDITDTVCVYQYLLAYQLRLASVFLNFGFFADKTGEVCREDRT